MDEDRDLQQIITGKRYSRKLNDKTAKALKDFQDVRAEGIGSRMKDFELKEKSKVIYEKLNDDEYNRYMEEEKRKYDAFIVDDDIVNDESMDMDESKMMLKDKKLKNEIKPFERRPSKTPENKIGNKMPRIFKSKGIVGKKTEKESGSLKDATDFLLNDILENIESKKKTSLSSLKKSKVTHLKKLNISVKKKNCFFATEVINDTQNFPSSSQSEDLFKKYQYIKKANEDDKKKAIQIDDSQFDLMDLANAEFELQEFERPNIQIETKKIVQKEENSLELNSWQQITSIAPTDASLENEFCDNDIQDKEPLSLANSDDIVPFFVLDATEEISAPGVVYFFGKICSSDTKDYCSCCLHLHDIQRTIFVIPKNHVFNEKESEIYVLETQAKAELSKKKELYKYLHELCNPLKIEIKKILSRYGVTEKIRIMPVKRKYAFEEAIPHREQYVLKVKFPDTRALPRSMEVGDHFLKVFGLMQSLLESVILKKRIKGPCWIGLSKPVLVQKQQQKSWCNIEFSLNSYKSIITKSDDEWQSWPAPTLRVASLSIKTILNSITHTNEIVMASIVCLNKIKCTEPMSKEQLDRKRNLRYVSAVSKMNKQPWPTGFEAYVQEKNRSISAGTTESVVTMHQSERALLNFMLAKITALDPDVFVGHNITAFDLPLILGRIQQNKADQWSRIGRLKRSKFPYIKEGASKSGLLSTLAGRLICDTYNMSRDLVREVDYTLSTLAEVLLKQKRQEIDTVEVPLMYESSESLKRLIDHTELDAWLSLELNFHLSMLPLTKQLSNLSGSLWNKALQGQRAQRIEMLLCHEFYQRKFLLPDKQQGPKGKITCNQDFNENEDVLVSTVGGKSGPQYAGGLVLEPKKGLYDKFVLLLDFNSLYPSIIQEYNICFTTVVRPVDGSIPSIPQTSSGPAPLPELIRELVERRKQVKNTILNTSDSVLKQQLNIRQQAIKLTANSIYGCLGFSQSRFFCKPIAELITCQGREILQSTVNLVEQRLGLQVVYGDTDSIMVNTGKENYEEVIQLGREIKKEINLHYKLLEIDIDAIFKSLLLLKKKKYAAVKIAMVNGQLREEIEQKGLDIVRRDWCPLVKTLGNLVLREILSGKNKDDIVIAIHNHLRDVNAKVMYNKVPLSQFVITKQLAKQVEEYPDGKNQPHVTVAIRRKSNGHRNGTLAGETVPYVICNQSMNTDRGGSDMKSLASRAYHPSEIEESNGKLTIDINYYLSQQIHPCIARLCAPIEETSDAFLAECLGLDPSKFKSTNIYGSSIKESIEDVSFLSGRGILEDPEIYRDLEKIKLKRADGTEFEFCGVSKILDGSVDIKNAFVPSGTDPSDFASQISPESLKEQITTQAQRHLSDYKENFIRSSAVGVDEENRDEANNSFHAVTQSGLYLQLLYMQRQIDISGENLEKASIKFKSDPGKYLELKELLEPSLEAINSIKDNCSIGWINISKFFT